MKKKVFAFLGVIVLLLLLNSGIFANIVKFFSWLFMLDYISPDISVGASIVVRILTFVVSYATVGFVFDLLNWYNSKAMSVFYFIVSTLVSFALCYIVMIIEQYWVWIVIAFAIIVTVSVVGIILIHLKNKQKN